MKQSLQKALGHFTSASSRNKPLELSVVEALEALLQKAVNDPTHGGLLHPVHIITKDGWHTVKYMRQDEIHNLRHYGEGNFVEPLREGHRFTHPKNGPGTITKVKGHDGKGYELMTKYDDGRKGTAYVHNLKLHKPEIDDHGVEYTQTKTKAGLVGHTESGKEVYSNKAPDQHKNFSASDHMDAASMYMDTKYGDTGYAFNQDLHDRQQEHEDLANVLRGGQKSVHPYRSLTKQEKEIVDILMEDEDEHLKKQGFGSDYNSYRDYKLGDSSFQPGFLEESGFGSYGNSEATQAKLDTRKYREAYGSLMTKLWQKTDADTDINPRTEEDNVEELKYELNGDLLKILDFIEAEPSLRKLYSEVHFDYRAGSLHAKTYKPLVNGKFEPLENLINRRLAKVRAGALPLDTPIPDRPTIFITPRPDNQHGMAFTTVHELGHYVHYKYAKEDWDTSSTEEREEFADSFVKLVAPKFKKEWRDGKAYGLKNGITTNEQKRTYQLAKQIVEDNKL